MDSLPFVIKEEVPTVSMSIKRWKIGWREALTSLLIAASGWWGGEALTKVDQDIRSIYAEYTLAATDLGHLNARLIRYRTTILRAIEADTKQQFESIAGSFPIQRGRIEGTLDRYLKASHKATSNPKVKTKEAEALIELRAKLDEYFDASQVTQHIVKQMWETASPREIHRLRELAENNAAENAGPKLIEVSIALDRLLEIVIEIAGDARKEDDSILRVATSAVIGVSFLLAAVVLIVPLGRRS